MKRVYLAIPFDVPDDTPEDLVAEVMNGQLKWDDGSLCQWGAWSTGDAFVTWASPLVTIYTDGRTWAYTQASPLMLPVQVEQSTADRFMESRQAHEEALAELSGLAALAAQDPQ